MVVFERQFADVEVAEVLTGQKELLRTNAKEHLAALVTFAGVKLRAVNTVLYKVVTHVFPDV